MVAEVKLGLRIEDSVVHLHVAARVIGFFALNVAGGIAEVVITVMGYGVVGPGVEAVAGAVSRAFIVTAVFSRHGFARRTVTILQRAANFEIKIVLFVWRQVEYRGATAHALLAVAIEDLVLGAAGQQAIDPQTQQAFNQRTGSVGVSLEQIAGVAVLLEGGIAVQ
ncbi:hypothetical protein D3C78_1425120 [compost metagenome]